MANVPVTTVDHLDEWVPFIEVAMHAEGRQRHWQQNGGK